MFARVVRFTDVTRERVEEIKQRINEPDGAPEGVPIAGIRVLFDEAQGVAVVVQLYASAEDMAEGERALDAMPADETPGTRVSVDRTEEIARMDA